MLPIWSAGKRSATVPFLKGTDVKVIDTIDMVGIVSHAVFTPDGKRACGLTSQAFGLQKTGRRILTHIRNSLTFLSRDGTLARDAEFWSVPGRTVSFIRNRRMAALPLRKAVMIAPAEYRLAIFTAVQEAVALSRDDLVIQAACLFGFDRTGADLKQEIEQ